MSQIVTIDHRSWTASATATVEADAVSALERGDVLLLSDLAFPIETGEWKIFSPDILSSSKNTSFDPRQRRVSGTTVEREDLASLEVLMARFSDGAATLVDRLLSQYRGRVERARASFRPAEIAGRQTSWRKDDTRLHVDSFPASPVQGRRILRVFTNVNPSGRARAWRVGGDFEAVAGRFARSLSLPMAGSSLLLRALRITKSRRSPYDALMLQLHDRMKEDAGFQTSSPQTSVDFPPGCTWMAFTDQVSHAAMSGQYQLEQTFYLPVQAMVDESRSPLRILERTMRRSLA